MKKALREIALLLSVLILAYAIAATQPRKYNFPLENPMRK